MNVGEHIQGSILMFLINHTASISVCHLQSIMILLFAALFSACTVVRVKDKKGVFKHEKCVLFVCFFPEKNLMTIIHFYQDTHTATPTKI